MLPKIDIEGALQLPENGPAILQTLFATYHRIIVKKEFSGNFSGSRVFLVQPITEHGAEYPVVVKFAALSLVEKEWRAYQRIGRMLYGMVKIQDKVLSSEGDWAALSYPLQGGGTFAIENLCDYCQNGEIHEIAPIFHRVFKTLESIHNQSRAVPGFFWRASYDPILPVNLLIEAGSPPLDAYVHILSVLDVRVQNVQPGDWVELRGFIVTKVDLRDHTVTLNLPYRMEHPDSFFVRLRITENPDAYRERQVVSPLIGQIVATRQSQLQGYLRSLVGAEVTMTAPSFNTDGVSLPNPFLKVETILDQYRDVRTALIHGDLNLYNVLVDVDTGHISLIDVAEAREDHILHDFLRIETEIVTKVLVDASYAKSLPAAQTLFEFYQALHCATFEPHTLHNQRAPLGLELPFEAIRAIRQAAMRHFYSDDPTEYYQGLLLYLVGSLKFGNLDHHQTAPLPKQAALWGAASVAWLLESTSVCKSFLDSVPDLAPPAALLVDYTPEVKILRKDTECFVPAAHGLSLYRDDVVSTFSEARALLYYRSGSLLTVPDDRNQRVDDSHIPSERIYAQLEKYEAARLPYLMNHFSSNITLPPETLSPLSLTPRQTRLHEARPVFHWRAVVGATAYRVSLRMPNGITWQYETPFTTLSYPDDAPALALGSGNTVLLEVIGASQQSETVYIEILDDQELVMLRTQEDIIRGLRISEVVEHHLLMLLYHRWKLWDAAIQQLERIAEEVQPLSSALWLYWGELCLRVGLYAQSEEYYLQAVVAGELERDTSAQIVAHTGLVCASIAQSHYRQARNYLDNTGLQEDNAVIQFMRSRLETVTHREHLVAPPSLSLFSYVRSLAERIAAHLTTEMRQIPDRFLAQLQTMSQYTLRPAAGAWSTLGTDKFAAMEMLAMTYITTRTLSETFPQAELERQRQIGQLEQTLKDHAQRTACVALGVSSEKAVDFANHYATLVGDNLDILHQVLQSEGA